VPRWITASTLHGPDRGTAIEDDGSGAERAGRAKSLAPSACSTETARAGDGLDLRLASA
jgi:hypothetical protein